MDEMDDIDISMVVKLALVSNIYADHLPPFWWWNKDPSKPPFRGNFLAADCSIQDRIVRSQQEIVELRNASAGIYTRKTKCISDSYTSCCCFFFASKSYHRESLL